MAIGAEHCLPWLAESFLMYRMADAIAGPAIPDPEPLTCTQKEEMMDLLQRLADHCHAKPRRYKGERASGARPLS